MSLLSRVASRNGAKESSDLLANKQHMILTITDDELNFLLLSVGFMNHQLQNENGHALTREEREKLEKYLKIRRDVRKKILNK